MDKYELYTALDIDDASEFCYYENMASLLEEDDVIDTDLIEELLSEMELSEFTTLVDSYLEEFLKKLPDEMTDLYLTVENIKRIMTGCADSVEMAEAVSKFRKWYVHDLLVVDLNTGDDLCVRDARYNISASVFTGESCNYDFRAAYEFEFEGYDVFLSNLIEDEADTEDYEQDYMTRS